MKKQAKSLYNMFFGLSDQIFKIIIGFIIPRLFITTFGSEINGLLGSISYIYLYLGLLESGIGTTTIQALFKPFGGNDKAGINSIISATNIYYKRISFYYIASVLVFGIVYPLSIKTTIPFSTIFLIILIHGMGSIIKFIFYGKYQLLILADGKGFVLSIISTIDFFLVSLIKILLIYKGYNVVVVYLAHLISIVIQSAFYNYYIRRSYSWLNLNFKPDFSSISQKYSALTHQIANLICNNTDVLVLTYISRNFKLVSIYLLYTLIYDSLKTLLINIFSSVHFILGQTFANNFGLYKKMLNVYEVVNFVLVFSFYSTAYVLITPFMTIYSTGFDIQYVDKYLPILFTLIKMLTSGRDPLSQLIYYAGHFKKTQNRAIIEAAINLFTSIILVIKFGIYGVLIGTIVSLLYRTIDITVYANKKILNQNLQQSIKLWGSNIFGFLIVIITNNFVKLSIVNYTSFILFALPILIIITIFYSLLNYSLNKLIFLDNKKFVLSFFKSR